MHSAVHIGDRWKHKFGETYIDCFQLFNFLDVSCLNLPTVIVQRV